MDVLGLDHAQLAMPRGREDEARAFYEALVGLTETPKPAALLHRGGVWFVLGPQELHLGIEDPFTPARKAHPGIRLAEAELDALAQRLTAASVDVTWDDAIPGVRRFYASDPFGNRLEFLA